jgi:hypothetical protein
MVAQILQMVEEIKKCESAGATTACIMQIFVYIDVLSYINMPIDQSKNTRKEFIDWVDKYLKAHETQAYQYRGIDIYGARCALLHTFSSEADFHEKNPNTIRFGYTDGGKHCFKPDVDPNFALIGTICLIDDFIKGVACFFEDIKKRIVNLSEKSVLQERINKIFEILPFPQSNIVSK